MMTRGRIPGVIRWEGIQVMNPDQPIKMLDELDYDPFGQDSLSIGVLVPLTPDEMA